MDGEVVLVEIQPRRPATFTLFNGGDSLAIPILSRKHIWFLKISKLF